MLQAIQASLAFTQLAVAELLSFLNAVYARMKDNPAFTVNLPFDMATFKAAIDSFASAVDAALDGSKTAIAQRNRQREVVIKMLRQLAHYVEAASKDDMSLLLSSGFEVRPTGRTKSPPLSQFIRKIDAGGNSGQLLVSVVPFPEAHSYEVRWAPANTGGTEPTWTTHSLGKTKRPITAGNLTPGTAYVFQGRALTDSGFTDWSDPITRICT